MSKNIEQTIKEMMSIVLHIDAGKVNDRTSVDNTPGWDSANQINLILALEDTFSISFDVSEFELMVSFANIVKAVREKT